MRPLGPAATAPTVRAGPPLYTGRVVLPTPLRGGPRAGRLRKLAPTRAGLALRAGRCQRTRSGRHAEAEGGALARGAPHPDVPAVRLHDEPADVEAQAEPLH